MAMIILMPTNIFTFMQKNSGPLVVAFHHTVCLVSRIERNVCTCDTVVSPFLNFNDILHFFCDFILMNVLDIE